jgi:hypothetical protein
MPDSAPIQVSSCAIENTCSNNADAEALQRAATGFAAAPADTTPHATPPAPLRPVCCEVRNMRVDRDGDKIRITFELDSGVRMSFRLPLKMAMIDCQIAARMGIALKNELYPCAVPGSEPSTRTRVRKRYAATDNGLRPQSISTKTRRPGRPRKLTFRVDDGTHA